MTTICHVFTAFSLFIALLSFFPLNLCRCLCVSLLFRNYVAFSYCLIPYCCVSFLFSPFPFSFFFSLLISALFVQLSELKLSLFAFLTLLFSPSLSVLDGNLAVDFHLKPFSLYALISLFNSPTVSHTLTPWDFLDVCFFLTLSLFLLFSFSFLASLCFHSAAKFSRQALFPLCSNLTFPPCKYVYLSLTALAGKLIIITSISLTHLLSLSFSVKLFLPLVFISISSPLTQILTHYNRGTALKHLAF